MTQIDIWYDTLSHKTFYGRSHTRWHPAHNAQIGHVRTDELASQHGFNCLAKVTTGVKFKDRPEVTQSNQF